jgi:hypothetical protein
LVGFGWFWLVGFGWLVFGWLVLVSGRKIAVRPTAERQPQIFPVSGSLFD